MSWRRFLLAWAGYVVATFAGGAVWHLLLFRHIYIDLAIFTRIEDPILALGLSAMVLQGALLAFLYPRVSRRVRPALEGIRFGLIAGVFLATGTVIAEAAKQNVTCLGTWLALESAYYLLQFALSGMVIGLAYGRSETVPASPANAR